MRKKIIDALKTEYSKYGLSVAALDGVAGVIEKTITDESGIDAAIKEASVKSLCEIYQRETDSLRSAKAEAEKALRSISAPTPPVEPKPAEVDSESARMLKELRAEFDAQKLELAAERKLRSDAEIVKQLTEALKNDGCPNDFILRTSLSGITIKEGDTVASLKQTYKDIYNANYKEAYGDGAVVPAGGFFPPMATDDEHEFDGTVARLNSQGIQVKH